MERKGRSESEEVTEKLRLLAHHSLVVYTCLPFNFVYHRQGQRKGLRMSVCVCERERERGGETE